MGRPLTYLAAAIFAVGATGLSLAPAQAAPRVAPVTEIGSPAVELVGNSWDNNRHRHHHRRYSDNNRHRHHHRRDVRPGFFFSFPFMFQPPRRDCYRGYDGRIYCAR